MIILIINSMKCTLITVKVNGDFCRYEEFWDGESLNELDSI